MKDIEKKPETKVKKLFGFEFSDLSSFKNFVVLMNRPEDPSNLAIFRILFGNNMCFIFVNWLKDDIFQILGLVMMIDIPHERGMSDADIVYGSNIDCIFPLFDFLKPFDANWMLIIYSIMFLGITISFISF